MPQETVDRMTEALDRRQDRWHMGKEVPLALIGAFILQTGGIIWSYASLVNKVDALIDTNREFRADRYTKEDGRRDREYTMQVAAAQTQRDVEQDRRIAANEQLVNELRRAAK